jgi:Flp pilus assembly protein TadD
MVIVAVALTWRTWDRNRDYHSRFLIWSRNTRYRPESFTAHNNLGMALANDRQMGEAAKSFARAYRLRPDRADYRGNLAGILVLADAAGDEPFAGTGPGDGADLSEVNRELGMELLAERDFAKAAVHLRYRVKRRPDDVMAQTALGMALDKQGDPHSALLQYMKVLAFSPNIPPALNNAAWIRATAADASLRDGEEAVRLAERLCRLSATPFDLDTLAAAYAEAGRFAEAVATAEKALGAAAAAGNETLATKIGRRLELYRRGEAFRE